MKAENYILISPAVRENAIKRIMELSCDGKTKITIASAGNKSARQRGLQWMWYTEVAKAGIGGRHEDTKDGVHSIAKWRWALPILLRDDDFFAELYLMFVNKYGNDPDRLQWFTSTQVSTESLNTSQMAEFLTEFQRHYGEHVNLTYPQDRGLLDYAKMQQDSL